jgi:hypothetical protein
MATASIDDLLAVLDEILIKGNYVGPEPFQDLNTGITIFQQAYLRAKIDEVPEDRLELLRIWIESAQAMIAAAQPTQPAPTPEAAPGPEMPPEGQPPMPVA